MPALHKLKYTTAVQIYSSASQSATYSFLNCIIILVVLVSPMTFQDPE
jgi:hypothetical protein